MPEAPPAPQKIEPRPVAPRPPMAPKPAEPAILPSLFGAGYGTYRTKPTSFLYSYGIVTVGAILLIFIASMAPPVAQFIEQLPSTEIVLSAPPAVLTATMGLPAGVSGPASNGSGSGGGVGTGRGGGLGAGNGAYRVGGGVSAPV